jgi:hypothetical protein
MADGGGEQVGHDLGPLTTVADLTYITYITPQAGGCVANITIQLRPHDASDRETSAGKAGHWPHGARARLQSKRTTATPTVYLGSSRAEGWTTKPQLAERLHSC